MLLVTLAPGVQAAFKTTSLTGGDWVLVIGTALLGTFWLETRKWIAVFNVNLKQQMTFPESSWGGSIR